MFPNAYFPDPYYPGAAFPPVVSAVVIQLRRPISGGRKLVEQAIDDEQDVITLLIAMMDD